MKRLRSVEAARSVRTDQAERESEELRCQCGVTIGGKTGRVCPLPRGQRCQYLKTSVTRVK